MWIRQSDSKIQASNHETIPPFNVDDLSKDTHQEDSDEWGARSKCVRYRAESDQGITLTLLCIKCQLERLGISIPVSTRLLVLGCFFFFFEITIQKANKISALITKHQVKTKLITLNLKYWVSSNKRRDNLTTILSVIIYSKYLNSLSGLKIILSILCF